ncbi:MAG: RNA polymerase sigma factor [Chloroflexota bacterium]
MSAIRPAAEGYEPGPATNNGAAEDELALVDALLDGQEAAFVKLLNLYHASLLRLALIYTRDPAVAEEVVQETWLGVLNGLSRFERRSSLKTWIFRILANQARTRGKREARAVPFSALGGNEATDDAASGSPELSPLERLNVPGQLSWPPRSWQDVPEERLLSRETRGKIFEAVAALPTSQREVITLRDVEGWSTEEVRNVLDITDTNQRVLLHRARTKVRQALEEYLRHD